MGILGKALTAALAFLFLLGMTGSVQAKASVSGTTINIWSEGGSHVQTCDTLRTDVNNVGIVNSCNSPFSGSTCISIASGYTLNITRGSAGNWTNFTVNGCELRMNETANGLSNITSWGNFTVINSNITTNTSSYKSGIIIQPNSNFSMTDSFVSQMGWQDSANKRGLELNSPTFTFNNNTLTRNFHGITLYGGAGGSKISNVTSSINNELGIYLSSSSGNTLDNFVVSSSLYGIYLYVSYNNTLTNITANSNNRGIYLLTNSNNNTFTNITANSNSNIGISVSSSSNNTFTGVNIWNCGTTTNGCIWLTASQNNTFRQGTVNLTKRFIVDMQSNSVNTIFHDIRFINTTQINGGINLTTTSSATFLNCTFTGVTESVSGNSQLIRQWYADVFSTDGASPLSDVVLAITNDGQPTATTSADGYAPRQNITSYTNNSGIVTPKTLQISATKSGYNDASYDPNQLNDNAVGAGRITLTLTPICTPSTPLCNGVCPSGCTHSDDPDCAPASACADDQPCSASQYCQSGICSSVDNTCQPPSGGGTSSGSPGFEPSIFAVIAASLFAGLFLLRTNTKP